MELRGVALIRANDSSQTDRQTGVIASHIAAYLLHRPNAHQYVLAPGFGHQQLADTVGSPRTLVTQALIQMREIGVLEMKQHGVLIRDRIRLAQIAAASTRRLCIDCHPLT